MAGTTHPRRSPLPYPAIPHLELPVRRGAGGALVAVEQDTLDDIASCTRLILSTPPGTIDTNPELGVPELAFMPSDPDAIRAAVERFEPRADVLVSEDPARVSDLVREVRVEVDTL